MKKSEEKKNIFGLIGFVIFVGNACTICLSVCYSVILGATKIQGVEIWNQFVSIVLGIVATILKNNLF